jgi:succinylglutamic semialdehyde dehydrogenase
MADLTPITSYEPATGALLWEGTTSDVALEIARVSETAPIWAALPFGQRVEMVRRFGNQIRNAQEPLADLVSRETGRPLWDTRAEVVAMAARVDLAVTAASERAGQRQSEGAMGARQMMRHRPHGVVAVIAPHAQAGQIISDAASAALVAGNGLLLKPSEKTPAIAEALMHLLHAAGMPSGLVRCVFGGPEAGEALAQDPAVNTVLYTGSAQNGLAVARACASQPHKVLSLAMGGNNPIIAWDMVDLASAASLIVQSAFASTGQHCLSTRRLIVHDNLADILVGEVKRLADRLIIDEPHAELTPYMGPLISSEAADMLTDSFLYLMSNGGRPIKHMQRPKGELPFVTPGIIDVTAMEKRPDIEYFGPLLQVIRVSSFEEAVAEANATRYGLCAALVGGGQEHFDYLWANSRAGIVNWNRPTTAVPLNAPIGGRGLSGNHRPGGSYAADHCADPVIASATEYPRASIGIGLKLDDYATDAAEDAEAA